MLYLYTISLIPLILYSFVVNADASDNEVHDTCNLNPKLIAEIAGYAPTVKTIVGALTQGRYKGATYDRLGLFVDTFGPRMAGTDALEEAIDYILVESRKEGLDDVHGEEVQIVQWERGYENATLLTPRVRVLPILGLGFSVNTPPGGITAEVIVVRSFDELDRRAKEVTGKIVVYNQPFVSYGETVVYRSKGAERAAMHGAVAALVRSITAFSLRTPHAGMMSYNESVPKIPSACITPEDANLMDRLQVRGTKLTLHLELHSKLIPNKTTRNTVTQLTGREQSDNVVLVSGHLDSWDVAEGAVDDGAGAFISWHALVALKGLGLKPRRTLRAVLWTAEEIGLLGAYEYVQRHVVKNKTEKFNFVMESDMGTFEPQGLEYSGSKEGACIIKEILKLFQSMNATHLVQYPEVSSDIIYFQRHGIPGGSLLNANGKYTWFHHTAADTMDVLDSATLDRCAAFWAAFAYVVADITADIPRENKI